MHLNSANDYDIATVTPPSGHPFIDAFQDYLLKHGEESPWCYISPLGFFIAVEEMIDFSKVESMPKEAILLIEEHIQPYCQLWATLDYLHIRLKA